MNEWKKHLQSVGLKTDRTTAQRPHSSLGVTNKPIFLRLLVTKFFKVRLDGPTASALRFILWYLLSFLYVHTHINGEIHICISLSCLRSSCKRRSNGNRPATAQHDGTRTPRPTVSSCCAVVVRSCSRAVCIYWNPIKVHYYWRSLFATQAADNHYYFVHLCRLNCVLFLG